jgi:hypothetical protein
MKKAELEHVDYRLPASRRMARAARSNAYRAASATTLTTSTASQINATNFSVVSSIACLRRPGPRQQSEEMRKCVEAAGSVQLHPQLIGRCGRPCTNDVMPRLEKHLQERSYKVTSVTLWSHGL